MVVVKASNQYTRSAWPRAAGMTLDNLLARVELQDSQRRHCGELWGGRCRAWVQAPEWNHGQHPDFAQKLRLAGLRVCPPVILGRLSQDGNGQIRAEAASNPACPPELIQRLSQQRDYQVLWGVARNPACPLDVLDDLSVSVYPGVRRQVARHPACPLGVLERLLGDQVPHVAEDAANNPRTPRALRAMWQLAREED